MGHRTDCARKRASEPFSPSPLRRSCSSNTVFSIVLGACAKRWGAEWERLTVCSVRLSIITCRRGRAAAIAGMAVEGLGSSCCRWKGVDR
jgi:hypothetical protein